MVLKYRAFAVFVVILLLSFVMLGCESGGSRHARKEARLEESAKVSNVSGGETFQVNKPFIQSYDAVLNLLKRRHYTIQAASKEIGQIITAISSITGGWRQTGTRIKVTLIKDSEAQTSILVAVMKHSRYKALVVEPWSDPELDPEESAKLAKEIKDILEK